MPDRGVCVYGAVNVNILDKQKGERKNMDTAVAAMVAHIRLVLAITLSIALAGCGEKERGQAFYACQSQAMAAPREDRNEAIDYCMKARGYPRNCTYHSGTDFDWCYSLKPPDEWWNGLKDACSRGMDPCVKYPFGG
jgi:hypothetical protein